MHALRGKRVNGGNIGSVGTLSPGILSCFFISKSLSKAKLQATGTITALVSNERVEVKKEGGCVCGLSTRVVKQSFYRAPGT